MRKRIVLCAAVMMALPAAIWAQPAINATNGVVNASSYTADVARGSWFVVFGTNMGPSSLSVYSGALPFPVTLSGTSVTFTPASGGSAVNAMLWYTSATQLAGLLPSTAQAGDYDVRVTYNNQPSQPRRIKVVERNFGFATQTQNGAGPAQATFGNEVTLNRFTTGSLGQWGTRPAKPGDSMVLWGTGLGADQNSDQTGATAGDQTAAGNVRVIVGGIEVTPAYAGRSSGSPGLDQVNFTVPSNVAPGCFVNLQVRAGNRLSNLGSIAVAESGKSACTQANLSDAQMTKLDQGGSLTLGSLLLSKTKIKMSIPGMGSFDMTTEEAGGSFARYTADTVGTANFSLLQSGSCYVVKRVGTQGELVLGKVPTPLDAGPQLTLNGPNASNKAIAKTPGSSGSYGTTLYASGFGGYGGQGSPTITSGSYSMSGPGGNDIGQFTASLSVPGDFTWTNQDSIADPISRSNGLTINWNGGGSGIVSIFGIAGSQVGGTAQDPVLDATIFVCTAPASATTFTVPTSVLQQMPAVTVNPSGSGTAAGFLMVSTTPDPSKGQGTFTAPLKSGGNIDQGFFTYSIGSMKMTGWQ